MNDLFAHESNSDDGDIGDHDGFLRDRYTPRVKSQSSHGVLHCTQLCTQSPTTTRVCVTHLGEIRFDFGSRVKRGLSAASNLANSMTLALHSLDSQRDLILVQLLKSFLLASPSTTNKSMRV